MRGKYDLSNGGAWTGVPSACFLIATVALVVVGTALPVTARAYATVGPASTPGPTGLPDGRVYEQVTPANKNGNAVRIKGQPNKEKTFGLASEDGDAVVFNATGAMGAAYSGSVGVFVSRRSASGWSTNSAIPRPLGVLSIEDRIRTFLPSSDFSRFEFNATASFVAGQPQQSVGLFLSDDPAVEPVWLARPIAQPPSFSPVPAPGQNNSFHDYLVAGATPDLGTVYFTYSGTLIPQDAPRAPNVGDGRANNLTDAWGFYEASNGTLTEAGVLPNRTLSPFGAVPAAMASSSGNFSRDSNGFQAQEQANEVSTDGSRAFFVSPDPDASTVTDAAACMESGPCTTAPPELYVRETAPDAAKSTVLVSQSQLPGAQGDLAPDGASFLYASPDGSQVFFQSTDDLTQTAGKDSPGSEPKTYDFDVNTGALYYLPGVTGAIVAADNDGSSFAFVRPPAGNEPAELELWIAGPQGAADGTVTPITQMPAPPNEGSLNVSSGRASGDGSVFVFRTNSPLPGGFNDAAGFAEVYRYDVTTNALDCVSCPPAGILPSGDAHVSYDAESQEPESVLDTRVISADGSRVFFDSPDPLVPQATNGKRDVYEWENGSLFLISSGKSAENDYVLDSSASGADVFFATAAGLVPGDADEAYDVYDARIPRPGDNPPPVGVPCAGDVCQGPPSVPSLLGAPPSATFSGVGNLTPTEVKPPAKKTKKKTVKCKRGFVKKKNKKCVKISKIKSHKGGK